MRLLGAQVLFVVVAFGGVPAWSQFLFLGMALVTFLLLFMPGFRDGRSARSATAGENALLILRFPGFWLGLLVAAYVLMGAWNPAWTYVTDGAYWWMLERPHDPRLPSGVEAPFSGMNAWRQLLIWSGPWLTICTIHVGLRRRRSLEHLWTIIAVGLAAFGVFAFLQWLSGTDRILGLVESENPAFWGTIVYGNQAAAILNLGLIIALSLTLYHQRRLHSTLQRSSPHLPMLACGLAMGGSVVGSLSRGGILALAVIMLLFVLLAALQAIRSRMQGGPMAGMLIPAVVVLMLTSAFYAAFDRNLITRELSRLEQVFRDPKRDLRYRLNVATIDMLEDRWLYGWGAGGFRHMFPLYQQKHPELRDLGWGRSVHFRYAHNDLLQFPVEFGLVGASLLAAFPVGWMVALARRRRWLHADAALRIAGAIVVLAHAGVDFLFYCPAILTLWGLLWAGTYRQADAERVRGSPGRDLPD